MGRRWEGAAGEDEPRFRISVCMKRFFADERARCALLVGARRRVRWLRRRLRALFPLPPRLALLARGHLLPPDEPLALLDRDDLVEVIPRSARSERVRCSGEDAEDGARDSEAATTPPSPAVESDDRALRATDEPPTGNDLVKSFSPSRIESEIVDAMDTSDVVDARVLSSSEVCARPRCATEPDELDDTKRRALEMLDRYCASGGAPRARRRRVRRRRRPPPLEPDTFGDRAPAAGEHERGEPQSALQSDDEPQGAVRCDDEPQGTEGSEEEPQGGVRRDEPQGAVRRNDEPRARAPRLVRSLSPAAARETAVVH